MNALLFTYGSIIDHSLLGKYTDSYFNLICFVIEKSLIKLEGWENMVTIISSDMRCWDAPEKADILVTPFSKKLSW